MGVAVVRLGLALVVAAIALPVWSESVPTADQIIANMNARDEGEHVTRKLIMTLTDKRGKERVRETLGYRKFYGEEKRTVLFYLSPANIRDTAFMTFDYPEYETDDDQWLYLPAARKVRRISASDRGDYFLGTDFSYEEIKKESKIEAQDYTYELLGQEEVDGKLTYHVEAVPKTEDIAEELGYGKVHFWIDSEIWMPRKTEFWDIRMNPLKTIFTKDIEQIDGVWTARHIVAKNHKTGHTSDFQFEEIDYETPVDDDLFTQRALRRGETGS